MPDPRRSGRLTDSAPRSQRGARWLARFVLCAAVCAGGPALSQEVARFGAWRAFCAPVAGCVLGVKSEEGDTLAFVEPPNGDDRLILVLNEPVPEGAEIVVSVDGLPPLVLAPGTDWRLVDSVVGPVVRISTSVMRDALMQPMLRHDLLGIGYTVGRNSVRHILFSLSGYADTRGYADDE